jgi:hypothetical protein
MTGVLHITSNRLLLLLQWNIAVTVIKHLVAVAPPLSALAELSFNVLFCNCRLLLLYLDLGDSSSSSTLLDVMNSFSLTNSHQALQGVQLLVLRLPQPAVHDAHKAYAMYQHLYQELGFVGYFHGWEMAVAREANDLQPRSGISASGVVLKLGLTRQRVT